LLEKLEKQIIDNQIIKDELMAEKKAILATKAAIIKEKNAIEASHNLYVEKANKDTDKYLNELKQQAEELLQQLKSQKNQEISAKQLVNKLNDIEVYQDSFDEIEDNDKNFNIGELVELKKSSQVGKIVSINRKKVIISLNGINVSAKLTDIKHTKRKLVVKKPKKAYKPREFTAFSTELNVIGFHVDEALDKVSRFIDQAILNKASNIRIIHGVGTGVLRKTIHEYLKNNKYIKSYHVADANNGGTGATEVVLK